MDRPTLDAFIQEEFQKIVHINDTKGHDYASQEDALSNLKDAAKALGLNPAQVWAVFANKHWTSVLTFCREGDVKSEPIEGRLHDVILYCLLLLALIKEETAFDQAGPTGQFG